MPGAAPHPHWRREREVYISRSSQSRTRALCSRRPTTHLRLRVAARPCSPCFHLFILSRAAVHDAGSSGGAAASQCCSSLNQHLFVAARRHRRCLAAVQQHARRQLKTFRRLVPGSIPAHADPCGDVINIGMGTKLFRCAASAPLRLTELPAVFAEHTDHQPLHLSVSLAMCGVVARFMARASTPWRGMRWSSRRGSKTQILSTCFLRGLHFSYVNGVLLCVRVCACGEHDFQGKMAF